MEFFISKHLPLKHNIIATLLLCFEKPHYWPQYKKKWNAIFLYVFVLLFFKLPFLPHIMGSFHSLEQPPLKIYFQLLTHYKHYRKWCLFLFKKSLRILNTFDSADITDRRKKIVVP